MFSYSLELSKCLRAARINGGNARKQVQVIENALNTRFMFAKTEAVIIECEKGNYLLDTIKNELSRQGYSY